MNDEIFAAVVVTYYPSSLFLSNIRYIAKSVQFLVVIDNTPEIVNFPDIKAPNVSVIYNRRNVGLSHALNEGIDLAASFGHENIFLFDQDSQPTDHYFKSMMAFKHKIDETISTCALYVPNFYDQNSKTFARFPVIGSNSLNFVQCNNMMPYYLKKALIAITSGTLINYSKFKEIGEFRQDYFIDFIDNEFCLRASIKGYNIAVNCNAILPHSIGKRSHKSIYGITLKPNYHNAVRRYYISRNSVRTGVDFLFSYPLYVLYVVSLLVHEFLCILLYENNKKDKIFALFYGIFHGIISKMGECSLKFLRENQADI